jgi:hypothetical protein
MEIDLVYLWVDGNDPAWRERKRAFLGEPPDDGGETNCTARWADNDELRYSLRSAERFAPWIRRVFIVTDGQTPAWLDTSNPRVTIVDHREIMPPQALPCYNACVIEHFIYRIPGLAEHFLYSNDDTFFGAPLTPDFFFAADGYPILRLKRKICGKLREAVKRWLKVGYGHYRRALLRSARQVERVTGRYFSGIPHHNIDSYRKSDYRRAVEDVFGDEVESSLSHSIRTEGDFHRSAIALWTLATGHAHRKYVARKSESCRIGVHKPDYMETIRRYSPRLFCLNDSQRASDADRERIRPFLEELFPEPSSFEK